jgi:hypothetical protein
MVRAGCEGDALRAFKIYANAIIVIFIIIMQIKYGKVFMDGEDLQGVVVSRSFSVFIGAVEVRVNSLKTFTIYSTTAYFTLKKGDMVNVRGLKDMFFVSADHCVNLKRVKLA